MDSPNDPYQVLSRLFDAARAKDEFEFCCTLMRIRGIEDAGWDPFDESLRLSGQLTSLLQAPLAEDLRFRMAMFLYCHLTEMDDIYKVVLNLIRITTGDRYSLDPFSELPKPEKVRTSGDPLNARIRQLASFAKNSDWPGVASLFELSFLRPVRNAFYHSDYILTAESFNIRWGEGVEVEGEVTHKIPSDWIVPRVNLGINTGLATVELVVDHIRSYTEDKIVRGRFGPGGELMDLQILTDSKWGLRGFKSPPTMEPEKGDAT